MRSPWGRDVVFAGNIVPMASTDRALCMYKNTASVVLPSTS